MTFSRPQGSNKTSSASYLDIRSVVLHFSARLLRDPSVVILSVRAGTYDGPNVGCSGRGHTHHGIIAVLSKKEQSDRDWQVALSFNTVMVPWTF